MHSPLPGPNTEISISSAAGADPALLHANDTTKRSAALVGRLQFFAAIRRHSTKRDIGESPTSGAARSKHVVDCQSEKCPWDEKWKVVVSNLVNRDHGLLNRPHHVFAKNPLQLSDKGGFQHLGNHAVPLSHHLVLGRLSLGNRCNCHPRHLLAVDRQRLCTRGLNAWLARWRSRTPLPLFFLTAKQATALRSLDRLNLRPGTRTLAGYLQSNRTHLPSTIWFTYRMERSTDLSKLTSK
jgi:hypothetical protein